MKMNPMVTTLVVAAVVGVVGVGVGFELRGLPHFNKMAGGAMAGELFKQGQGLGGRGGRDERGSDRGGLGGMNRGGAVGEVTAVDDKSLTVKMPDGSSKIVLTSDTTTYETTTKVDKTGLKTGITVRIIGATNSDGSITGTNVMLNPVLPPQLVKPTEAK